MNLFKQILGTDLFDSAVNAVDKLVLTDEEKLDIHLKFLKAYHPFKVTQRLISLIVLIPYAVSFLMSQIIYIVGLIMHSSYIMDGSQFLLENANGTFQNLLLVIVGFYFTGGVINSVNKIKSK